MIKKIAWNMFKTTGNVDTFLELKQIENIQNNLANSEQKVNINGNNKNEGNNNCRK